MTVGAYPENLIGKGNYHDTGCEAAPSCLECPFLKCLDEQTSMHELRDAEINFKRQNGEPVADLMIEFGLSDRSISRITQKAREMV